MSNRFDLKVVNKLAQYIKENSIDVIHTHGYKSDIIGVLAAKKAKIPVVITPHGFENAEDFKRIGFIGQMISRKNIFDVLNIFDELASQRDDIELVLLGDGDERANLEQHTYGLASKADIHFLGYRDDRLDYLRSFDLFVMTSTLEGIPRCLMEACAMAIPIAAYEIAGIDQLISHEETGLLADLGDKKTLASYWERLLDDKDYANQLGYNAVQYVNENYAAKRMADEYTALFKQLLINR